MTGRANARPPCQRELSPPQGGDWGTPLTGNAPHVAPSSVICFANATFPPRGRSGASGRPRPTWLPPPRGKLSADRLTDEGAHGDDGLSALRSLIRHLLRKCHLPPRGKVRRVKDAAPYEKFWFAVVRRGRCPHRPARSRRVQEAAPYMACIIRWDTHGTPAGGHIGPPLRIPTSETDEALRRGPIKFLTPNS